MVNKSTGMVLGQPIEDCDNLALHKVSDPVLSFFVKNILLFWTVCVKDE